MDINYHFCFVRRDDNGFIIEAAVRFYKGAFQNFGAINPVTKQAATTEYIATAEDDTLYHKSHFAFRPKCFGYNMNKWSLFTWSDPPIFSNKWDKAIHPLSWLVERFWPVPGWKQEDLDKLKAVCT
jgi:hypothetical protein